MNVFIASAHYDHASRNFDRPRSKMRRMTKRKLKENEAYTLHLRQVLEELGCKPAPEGQVFPGFYRYTIETCAGRLLVDAHPNNVEPGAWVPTRFVDVDRAVALLGDNTYGTGVNPYTGKWNHHFFEVTVEEAEQHLREQFARVLPAKVGT